MNLLTKAAESNEYTTGIYVVNHSTLPQKSFFYANYHRWLKDYFTNRKQIVENNRVISTPMPVTCGAPQRSVFGPLLFVIYFSK